MCGVNLDNINNKVLNLNEELSQYVVSKEKYNYNLIEFWRLNCAKYRILAEYVKYYCIIPASSVPSESSFSKANYIQRKERSSLSAKHLRFSMILRQKVTLKELGFLD